MFCASLLGFFLCFLLEGALCDGVALVCAVVLFVCLVCLVVLFCWFSCLFVVVGFGGSFS